jgi:hypothetical protein
MDFTKDMTMPAAPLPADFGLIGLVAVLMAAVILLSMSLFGLLRIPKALFAPILMGSPVPPSSSE